MELNLSVSGLNPQARVPIASKKAGKAGFLPKIENQKMTEKKSIRSSQSSQPKVRGVDSTMATSGMALSQANRSQQLGHSAGNNVAVGHSSGNNGMQMTAFTDNINDVDGVDLSRAMAELALAATTDSAVGDIDMDATPLVQQEVTPLNMDTVNVAKDSNVFMVDTVPTPRSAATMAKQAPRKPKSMKRATAWSPEVENLFRFQSAGFSNYDEYTSVYPDQDIEVWDTGFIKSLQNKHQLFMYFRRQPECESKHLNKVKIYHY